MAMTIDPHLQVLQKIIARLEDSPVDWVITGSLGMRLQGVPVAVHDIDLQTDQDGAYAIERRFAEFVVEPVRYLESERIRSHLGKLEMDGIQVEIMGAVQKRRPGRDWEETVDVRLYRQWVAVGGVQAPVVALEHEVQAYLLMGREEKAEMLREWLDRRDDTH